MRLLTASVDSWAAQHSLTETTFSYSCANVSKHPTEQICYLFFSHTYFSTINKPTAIKCSPNPGPDPLLSSSTPLCSSRYYTWGSKKKSFSPSVSVSASASEWACAVDLSYSFWNPIYALYRMWAVQFKKYTTLWNQTKFSLQQSVEAYSPLGFFSYQNAGFHLSPCIVVLKFLKKASFFFFPLQRAASKLISFPFFRCQNLGIIFIS